MYNFLAELPWWLMGGGVLAGIAVFLSGNAKVDNRLRGAGVGVIVLSLILVLLSVLLESDREATVRQTRELAASLEKQDWTKAKSLLHANVVLVAWSGAEDIIQGASTQIRAHGLSNVRLSSLKSAKEPDGTIRVEFTAATDHNQAQNVISRWQLDWQKTPDGWKVREIVPLEAPFGIGASVIDRIFGR